MEPLKDWYRYVDQVSRPARKDDPGRSEEEEAPWRPWKQDGGLVSEPNTAPRESLPGSVVVSSRGPRPADEEVEVDRIVPPPLFGNLAPGVVHTGTCLPAGRHYEDLTVNDTLQPIPEFTVPRLSAPLLEFDAPRIPLKTPSEPEPTAALPLVERRAAVEPVAAPEPARPDFRFPATDVSPSTIREASPAVFAEAAALSPAPAPATLAPAAQPVETLDQVERRAGEEGDRGDKAPRHWDLLTQIRGRDVAQNSYKSQFQETREELVQRLLDPELTLEETARLLDVCPTTVRRYTNKGQLRCFRTPGNQRRFRLSDILEFMENRVAEPGDETDSGESEPS